MNQVKITVSATINAHLEKVWDYYTNPKHIVNWNFADPSWHCPSAENDMRIGGIYKARMEAKDGSFGFDFEAIYSEIVINKHFTYEFGGRAATVQFKDMGSQVEVAITFDPESENPIEMQKDGWQAILNNFKKYSEFSKLEFSIDILAPKQKVWDTMLSLDTYQQWVGVSWPDSTYEGKWEKGSQIRFVGSDKSGTLAEIVELRLYEYVYAKHIAILLEGGVIDKESEFAENWIGIAENYFFSETNGITKLKIEIESPFDFVKMFNDGLPNALKKLKEICEK